MMGLGAVASSSTACSGSGDDGAGGEGAGAADDDDGGYPSAVSTYGVGPSSSTSSQSSTSTGDVCPGVNDFTPCQACIKVSCCDEQLSCLDSEPCDDFLGCIDVCDPNDVACVTACQEAHPEGFTIWDALRECMSVSCEQQCEPLP